MLGNFHVAVMRGCRPRSPARVDNGCTLEFFQRYVIEIPQRHTARVSSFTGLVLKAVLITSDPSFGQSAGSPGNGNELPLHDDGGEQAQVIHGVGSGCL